MPTNKPSSGRRLTRTRTLYWSNRLPNLGARDLHFIYPRRNRIRLARNDGLSTAVIYSEYLLQDALRLPAHAFERLGMCEFTNDRIGRSDNDGFLFGRFPVLGSGCRSFVPHDVQ